MFQTVRTNYSPYQKNKAGSPKLKPRTGKDQSCFKDGESKGACIGGGGIKFKIMLKKKDRESQSSRQALFFCKVHIYLMA